MKYAEQTTVCGECSDDYCIEGIIKFFEEQKNG